MKRTTGLSTHQLARLAQWVSQSKPLHSVPAVLGVVGSLRATLIYLRHNLPQAATGELLGVSQSTVSRAVKALTGLVTPAGRLVRVSDPCPGSTHDVTALDASGPLEALDPAGRITDKGYTGQGMITPPRKPAGRKSPTVARQASRSINRIRCIVEQVNTHIKTWKILNEDHQRPLNTLPQTITATLLLYTYTTPPEITFKVERNEKSSPLAQESRV